MEINNKNMNVNQAAFIGSNNETAIEFCPFCGAVKKYLVEGQYEPGQIEDLDSVTLRILDHAAKLELFNSDFYNKAANIASDEKLKERFRHLARIEYVHAKIHQRLGGFEEMYKLRDISYERYSVDKLLIEQAKLREEHAVNYYKKYIEYIKSTKVKDILKILTEVEEEHIRLLCN
jgi:rubrerythrin